MRHAPTDGAQRPRTVDSSSLFRGLLLILGCFLVLTLALSVTDDSPVRGEVESQRPDFPELFRHIDRRLEKSYLDLERVQPRPLVERALSSLELKADAIYVEDFDDDKPYVAMHVGDHVKVLDLEDVKTRSDSVRLLETVFEFLSRHYRGESTLNELRYAAANGYLSGIDPHTLVFTPKSFEEFEVHIKGEIFGVGMMVGQNDDGRLEVHQVLHGTPAHRAGFQKGDIIARIGDESTINMTVMEAVHKIRGPKGSEIILTVKRPSRKDRNVLETISIPVKRDRVVIKSVESELIEDWDPEDRSPWDGGIGYVQVTHFDQKTTPALLENLERLEEENGGALGGLVLDLRGNSGGLLTQAVAMCDAFIKEGDIVVTAKKGDRLVRTPAQDDGDEPEYPVVLLADEGSASGAEIVLGALQKNGRGIVLGSRSFGKGSVQQLQRLPYGAQLKITVSEYLIPGDISIQENGVVPDVLAHEVVVQDDFTNLFPTGRTVGERDYESHIISKYATEEEPRYQVKYLAPEAKETSEEEPSARERFISGELRPEEDPLVQMALRILRLSGKPFDAQNLLEKKQEAFEDLRQQFLREIVERLEREDIDWSEPGSDAASPEDAQVKLDMGYELTEEPSGDAEDPVPMNMLVLRARLTNEGERPIYRIRGITRSDHYLFEDHEFLFGKVEPGATLERTRQVQLPYFPRGLNDRITLDLMVEDGEPFAAQSVAVKVPDAPRPAFAYSAKLISPGGETADRLSVGEDWKIRLHVENVGQGPVHKGIAILRTEMHQEIFLKKGRRELTELAGGESEELEFVFDVRNGEDDLEQYEFELVIYDQYSDESLSRDLEIWPSGAQGSDFPNGVVFRPPDVELALDDPEDEEVGVTEENTVRVRGEVHSDAEDFKAWITTVPLTGRHKTPDKVYFASSGGRDRLDVAAEVPLDPGVNLVTLVAQDRHGIERRRSVVVRRE